MKKSKRKKKSVCEMQDKEKKIRKRKSPGEKGRNELSTYTETQRKK